MNEHDLLKRLVAWGTAPGPVPSHDPELAALLRDAQAVVSAPFDDTALTDTETVFMPPPGLVEALSHIHDSALSLAGYCAAVVQVISPPAVDDQRDLPFADGGKV